MEEGVYDSLRYGIKLEALHANSTLTAGTSNWVTENQNYQNFYDQPVILGQVMSYNDVEWSVFWATGQNAGVPPDSNYFYAGKHVAEDVFTARDDETIGYIILEQGGGILGNKKYYAALGTNIVEGTENSDTGYIYPTLGLVEITSAVLSSAGMNDTNGGWPVLFTKIPFDSSDIILAIDEDQILDIERLHNNEEVAFIAFEELPEKTKTKAINKILSQKVIMRSIENVDITFYPNPFENILYMIVESDIYSHATIMVYDLHGKFILQNVVPTNTNNLFDTKNWDNGMYLINVNIGQNSSWIKVVKTRN